MHNSINVPQLVVRPRPSFFAYYLSCGKRLSNFLFHFLPRCVTSWNLKGSRGLLPWLPFGLSVLQRVDP